MFFIQMAGFPGAGKSTLAREIAKRTGAVIIDHDIIKSAFLDVTEEIEMDAKQAGKISYHLDWTLIESLMAQGHNIIFDSPCLYEEIIMKGTNLAHTYEAHYKYVECYLNNFDEINVRLKNRQRKKSQIKEILSIDQFTYAVEGSKKPQDQRYLIVDSSQPLDCYIEEVMHYILSEEGREIGEYTYCKSTKK
ncbi:MAG: AAA family ATPase [Solibacillus sp.]|uniref:AAA family ATPase n=1 Tax=Solibacillus sp. TaxID=1909654 RepID=UPI003315DCFC